MRGNPVPVVNTYQYLEILVTTEWKLKGVIEQRAEKAVVATGSQHLPSSMTEQKKCFQLRLPLWARVSVSQNNLTFIAKLPYIDCSALLNSLGNPTNDFWIDVTGRLINLPNGTNYYSHDAAYAAHILPYCRKARPTACTSRPWQRPLYPC
ncbi:hypothetical protein SeLEV6574_g07019 [Synchytrium endobioticum]|uniref:Uncharacterized protein n=1 Tax=Synchytrium endobioticum TaxID=286115 RepID=A0A507CJA7_9FUNG|nr:hypothetical protein SeLEV6574_g07019 [Synchytrium endobioticum]